MATARETELSVDPKSRVLRVIVLARALVGQANFPREIHNLDSAIADHRRGSGGWALRLCGLRRVVRMRAQWRRVRESRVRLWGPDSLRAV